MKPEIFKHEVLFDLEQHYKLPIRFAWIGLFSVCDREGRFRWKPRSLKADCLPFDEGVDFGVILEALLDSGMVLKYRVGAEWYGVIPTWKEHQSINNRESASELPSPDDAEEREGQWFYVTGTTHDPRVSDASTTREPRGSEAHKGKGKGKGKYKREVDPESRGGVGGNDDASPPAQPSPSRGHRLPEDWKPKVETIDSLVEKYKCAKPFLREEYCKFMDYWLSVPGARGRKVDWDRTFRNWIRRVLEDINPRGLGNPGGGASSRTATRQKQNSEAFRRVLEDGKDQAED